LFEECRERALVGKSCRQWGEEGSCVARVAVVVVAVVGTAGVVVGNTSGSFVAVAAVVVVERHKRVRTQAIARVRSST